KAMTGPTIEEQFSELGIKPIKGNKSVLAYTLLDLDGKEVSLKQYTGKTVLMNFWFISCPFCKNEKKELEKLKAKMEGKDFIILAVSVDKAYQVGGVEAYKKVNKMTVTVLHDPTSKVANSLGLGSVPTSYIIDKNGTLLGEAAQDRRWGEEGYVKLFKQLTQQKVAMK
ncbi:MAG TPA: TlpA family protein disulfide reductase, partial [Spirochaetes bacterium]|nr:TlpA family protein disulfide reductase [Spirochaetota bacterium]